MIKINSVLDTNCVYSFIEETQVKTTNADWPINYE